MSTYLLFRIGAQYRRYCLEDATVEVYAPDYGGWNPSLWNGVGLTAIRKAHHLVATNVRFK